MVFMFFRGLQQFFHECFALSIKKRTLALYCESITVKIHIMRIPRKFIPAKFSVNITPTDFDEETADDKDIDMGIYYGHSEGNVVINLH